MNPRHIRCGVRISAATIGTATFAAGCFFTVSEHQLSIPDLMLGLMFLVIVAGVWVLVEVIIGSFERFQAITSSRYAELQRVTEEQASAEAIAARTIRALVKEGPDADVVNLHGR